MRPVLLFLILLLPAWPARALPPDPMVGVLTQPGSAGLGLALRYERSPYVGVGGRYDLLPLYLYEGNRFYLQAYRAGLKLHTGPHDVVEAFVAQRFEGFPAGPLPAELRGMSVREPGVDGGLAWRHSQGPTTVYAEARKDASGVSDGAELRLGWLESWGDERRVIMPHIALALRDAALNGYYYGVQTEEARPGRPAYSAGAGLDVTLGLNTRWRLSQRWQLVGGVSVTRLSVAASRSPVVGNATLVGGYVGLAYDFGSGAAHWAEREEREPLIVRALGGWSSPCSLVSVLTLRCFSLDSTARTAIYGAEVGRTFLEDVNGWPLDIVGFVGFLYRDERQLQPDGWQVQAYMKAVYRGFPWRHRVRTRLGFGVGLSLASRVPYAEARDQAERGRTTSRFLNYLDPTIDVNLGDLTGSKRLGETYFGIGVSHRSGIFGSSELLGSVNGGSNYLYVYLETILR